MKTYEIQPSARRLVGSLRDIGYDFNTALADLVDNAIAASARKIDVEIQYRGASSFVVIADDGSGMAESGLNEALRLGSQRQYDPNDLGRFGLGLKTASLSQCRKLSVLSRRAPHRNRVVARQLDLGRIEKTDRWEIVEPLREGNLEYAAGLLKNGPGTVVVWEDLDRILGPGDPEGGWAKRRLAKLAPQLESYLGMVFHRYIKGQANTGRGLRIRVNGTRVAPWDPLAPEENTVQLLPLRWEVQGVGGVADVTLTRAVLPPRERFSSHEEFERLGGPRKWNRQQGLYIYRSDRLIQGGGWSGIRTIDEHLKLARAALDFPSKLDELFHVNVAKMKVSIPPDVRTMLEGPVHELCREADSIYRSDSAAGANGRSENRSASSTKVEGAGLAVRAAAMVAGMNTEQFRVFEKHLRETNPEVARLLGF